MKINNITRNKILNAGMRVAATGKTPFKNVLAKAMTNTVAEEKKKMAHDWIVGNRYLSKSEMEHNAAIVYDILTGYGFSVNAIAAMLGNMQVESTVNPGIWQNLKEGSAGGGGYGLVQWTPWTNYSDWAGSGWEENGDKECERIHYEFTHGKQYYSTSKYPMSASQFMKSDAAPSYLAYVFMNNYERPENRNQPLRQTYADRWYTFLTGLEPP